MTKKVRQSLTALIVVILMCLSVIATTFVVFQPKQAFAAEISGWDNDVSLTVGDVLQVPNGVKIDVDGTLVDYQSAIIIYPDGNIKELGNYVMNVPGKYVVKYQGTHENKTVTAEKMFTVAEKVYKLGNPASTATYLEAETFKENSKMPNLPADTVLYAGNEVAESAIELGLATGDSFTYNKVVNVYDLASENGGLVDVCTVYPGNRMTNPVNSQDANGAYVDAEVDALHFSIKLVDCYDENNYLEFLVSAGAENNFSGYRLNAGASYQNITGIQGTNTDYGATKCFIYDGGMYERFNIGRYQTTRTNGAVAARYDRLFKAGYKGISFSWDTTNNFIYSNYTDSKRGTNIVTMLDHEFMNPDNPFRGFTTGEVYFEVNFEVQSTNPCYAAITSILGMKGEELQNNVGLDTNAPQFKLDSAYTGSNKIMISKGQEFAIPEAEIVDVSSTGLYDVAVYYNYGTKLQTMCNVSDGKFIPKLAGTYTFVYSSVDSFGNKGEAYFEAICTDKPRFSFDKENKVDSLNAFVTASVPVLNPVALNGTAIETIAVIDPNGKRVDITDTAKNGSYSFVPQALGDYTIEYTFKDNLNTEIYSYKVACTGLGTVQFVDALPIPSIIIKDAYYDLQDYYAYKATNTEITSILGQYEVSKDGGETFEVIADNNKFFANVGDSVKELQFRISCDGKYSPVWKSVVVDVNILGEKDYAKYFYGADSVTLTQDFAQASFDDSFGTLGFATPFSLKAFELNFSVPNQNLSNLYIYLREIGTTEMGGYVISYETINGTVVYSVKSIDGRNTYATANLTGSLARSYSFSMAGNKLTSAENISAVIPALSAKDVELILAFEATSAFDVNIEKVCNQPFNNTVQSWNEAPAVVLYDTSTVVAGVGNEYTLPTFHVSSALYPTSLASLKLTLVDGNWNAVKDLNGQSIENRTLESGKNITIKIPSLDTFIGNFEYTNFDRTDMTSEIFVDGIYTIVSFDLVAPTVKFNDGLTEKTLVKTQKDTLYKFVSATATDDIATAEELDITYFVWNETNNLIAWDVTEYKFEKPGYYKICVLVRDGSKNEATTFYNLLVEGEDDTFVQTTPGSTTIREEREDGTVVTKKYYLGVHEIVVTERANDYFVKNGNSEYTILMPSSDKVSSDLLIAVGEFNAFLKEVTGLTLNIDYEGGAGYDVNKKYISLGRTDLAEAKGITAEISEMKNNGYKIVTVDDNIYIIAANDSGVINGVIGFYDIVANYEIYSEDTYNLDKLTDIKLCDFNVKDIPDVDYSLAEYGFMHDTGNDTIALHFRQEGGSTIMTAGDLEYVTNLRELHNTNEIVYPGNPKVEAEWLAIGADQLCYTARGDEESLDRMIKYVTDILITNIERYPVSQYPEKNAISLTCEDSGGCCGCESCAAERIKYGSDAAAVIKFCNKVIEGILEWMAKPENEAYDRGENFYLLFFAYADYKDCPATYDETQGKYVLNGDLYIHPQLATWLTAMDVKTCFSIYDSVNDVGRERLVAWQDVSKAIFYWTWNHAFQSPVIVRDTYTHYTSEAYQFYMSVSPIQYKEENTPSVKRYTGFEQLRAYITSKLTWDSTLDTSKLTDEWFKAMYGVAAPQMREVYDSMRIHESKVYGDKYGLDKLVNNSNAYDKEYWSLSTVKSWIDMLEKAYEINEKVNKIAHPETYAMIKQNIDYQYYYPAKAILMFYTPEEVGEQYYEVVKYLQENDAFFSSGFTWLAGTADNGSQWRNIIVD